ncbi:sigma-70 family RNA polymerase sigma factor [Pseudomonas cremoricolorata]|uniref:sigma-70 family RNA polymerase sigma factor n=1 Tax=Pseudomonas cremoricolorata TaxID=157783 RepID=UPI0003F4DC7E|nr:sigma-70 family RNA polymerase sigma factor [Pseudomonas cremoricolorata]
MSNGQHKAQFSALYDAHNSWLKRWLFRRLGCREVAADLAQDTFVRILSKGLAPQVERPRALLSTIAHGLFVNLLRRRQLEASYLEALASLPETLAPSAEERWQLFEALQAIDALLDGLPARVRTAFLWSQLEGLSHQQIAERLNVSKSSVRQYIARALLHCMSAAEGPGR